MPAPSLPSIVLLGPRGVGKTLLGRSLALRLDRRFVDLDDCARGRFDRASVAEIWRTAGEPAWRDAESECLAELLREASASAPLVIALGGGAPMVPGVQTSICGARERNQLVTILLLAPIATLRRRLDRRSSHRPSLTGRDPSAEIEVVLANRLPTYRAMADLEVDVGGLSSDQAVAALLAALSR